MELMNNIITVADTGNELLNKDVLYIRDQIAQGRKSSHEVARTLLKIKNEELFTVCADNFSDFCTNYFGINKATGSKLVKVAERFLGDDSYANYQISQLMELRNASDEQLALVNPKMTIKEIRAILNPKKELVDSSAESCDTATAEKSEKAENSKKTEKFETTIPEPTFEKVNGDGATTPDKIVGDDWTIILDDKHSWHHADIVSMRGLINFTDFLRTQLHIDTIDKAPMEKVTIRF